MAKNKFKGKRMVPEYLITKLEEMDPSGGGDYTAGYGIDITDDEISIDQDVVASKSELNGYIKNNDLNYASTFRGNGVYVKNEGAYTSTSYGDGSIGRNIPNQPGYTYTFPDKSGTFAMTVDIITSYDDLTDKPTIPDSTSDLVNDSGFITGITSAMVTTALGYTPGTSNFSGSYNDLTDKPTIPEGSTNPFMRVTDTNDAVFFSLTGAAGSFYKWLDVANESPIYVNLHALNPVYGTGLTSTYDTLNSQLEVAVDTTVVALKSDIPTVPTTATSTSTSTSTVTPTTETLVFTLQDNSTVTVTVMTGATVATTTTTTTTLS